MNVIYETYFEFSYCFKYCNFEILTPILLQIVLQYE